MGLYGELWVWGIMGKYGELCRMMGNYGELWGFVGLYGDLLGFLASHGEFWVFMGNGQAVPVVLQLCKTPIFHQNGPQHQ